MQLTDWLTALATLVTAIATVAVAWATIVNLRYIRKQLNVTLEAQVDQRRPLLYPAGQLVSPEEMFGPLTSSGEFNWNQKNVVIPIENSGSGVALNMCGLVMGTRDRALGERYSLWQAMPLAPQHPARRLQFDLGGAGFIPPSASIGADSLYAPDKPPPGQIMTGTPWIRARLTLTCRDVFGRRHVSIFDYNGDGSWSLVTVRPNASQDIIDLEEQSRPKRMAHT